MDYVYDLAGKIKQVTDPTGTYAMAYDNMGRLIGTTTTYSFLAGHTYTNAYTYDAASNRTGFTAPGGSTDTYGYDTLNRLTTLTDSGAGQFGFSYDGLGRRTQLTRPNGVNTNYGYDSLSRVLSVLHQNGTATLDGATYTYDNAGNRTAKANYLNNITEQYTYDPIYQLTQVVEGATTTESYSYDAVGNRLSSLGVSSYSYNSSNELTATSAVSYTHDANGNTLTKTNASGTTHYAWDFENRLSSVTLPGSGGTVAFKYDPFRRRIQKAFTQNSTTTVTTYLYDGADPIQEVDANGNTTARYTQGIAIDEHLAELRAGTTGFYEQDSLSSVSSLSSNAGALSNTYVYDSFGNLSTSTGSFGNPFQYTGRDFDSETGLRYHRNRYYDPAVGRFLSEDPIGFNGGLNFYVYAGNDPANSFDPSGLRDFIVVIWRQKGGSVGHAGIFELNGDVITSQFPECHCTVAPNKTRKWDKTLEEEGRNPDLIFQIHIPDKNDAALDKTAANHRNRPVWNWYPTKMEFWETNCVFASTRVLNAGGVPVPDYDWPGSLGDDLLGKANAKPGANPWTVTPLQRVPWVPPPSPTPTPKP